MAIDFTRDVSVSSPTVDLLTLILMLLDESIVVE